MRFGDPTTFAIESSITVAYERLSFRALGFFVIHISGHSYGVQAPDASLLACSFEEIKDRIARRGKHTAPFAAALDAGKIAYAFRNAIYAEEQDESYFGIPLSDFIHLIHSNHLTWAPDGEEAFDDGSYVLQFDVEDRVRLIAFKSKGYSYDPTSLTDVWLDSNRFYDILQQWYVAFEIEWATAPKQ